MASRNESLASFNRSRKKTKTAIRHPLQLLEIWRWFWKLLDDDNLVDAVRNFFSKCCSRLKGSAPKRFRGELTTTRYQQEEILVGKCFAGVYVPSGRTADFTVNHFKLSYELSASPQTRKQVTCQRHCIRYLKSFGRCRICVKFFSNRTCTWGYRECVCDLPTQV